MILANKISTSYRRYNDKLCKFEISTISTILNIENFMFINVIFLFGAVEVANNVASFASETGEEEGDTESGV